MSKRTSDVTYSEINENCIVHATVLWEMVKELEKKYYNLIHDSALYPAAMAEYEKRLMDNGGIDRDPQSFESENEKTVYTNHYYQWKDVKSKHEAAELNKKRLEDSIQHFKEALLMKKKWN